MSCTVLVRCQRKDVFSFEADDRPMAGDVIWGPTEGGYLVGEVRCAYTTHIRGTRTWGYTHVTVECAPYMGVA